MAIALIVVEHKYVGGRSDMNRLQKVTNKNDLVCLDSMKLWMEN